MVITSVSIDNHYNGAFILYLLPFTLEDVIVSRDQQPVISGARPPAALDLGLGLLR